MLARSRRGRLRKLVRRGGCLTILVIVVVIIAAIVLLSLIARDPSGAAGGISHWWGQIGDGARGVLRAPMNFVRSLQTFVENLFH
jgi:hypothetical protein